MNRLSNIVEALKLEHTIFALPFAYLGVWTAARGNPPWSVVGWVTLAMIGARTTGMAINRLVDLPIDRLNPRTQSWPVPAGKVSPALLTGLTLAAAALFFYSAARLSPLCFRLSPWALALMILYPYLKRFTWICHFGLGLVLACAPAAGWLAVTGRWEMTLLPLALGVLFWVAGFDILYALLDLDFDREHGVYSIPQRFGLSQALGVSSFCHAAAVLFFGWFGFSAGLGGWYWGGLSLVAALLAYEHRIVGPTSLARITKAFFTINGWVSVSLFLFTLLDLKVRFFS